MVKAEAQVGETTVEIDTEGMEKRIVENTDKIIEQKMGKYLEQLKDFEAKKEKGGKGVVESLKPESKQKIVEEFQKGSNLNIHKIKEQWTVAVPFQANYELAGHLRDYIFVTDIVNGKAGETVNIPYVKDIEFQHVVVKTGGFTAKTGLVNVLTTTLHESGAYYDAYYGDIEKIDSNMLDELNRVFAHAAIRAEDSDLTDLLDACTTADFSSPGATTRIAGGEDSTTSALNAGNTLTAMNTTFIARALGKLLQRGKDVRPGECVLVMNHRSYRDLISSILSSTSTGVGYHTPDVFTKGIIEDFMGVKFVIVGDRMGGPCGGSTQTFECAYLIRPKRALALAPKRDILIETDKLIDMRQLRITASHTYGVCSLDESEIVRIPTSVEISGAI